MQSLNTVSIDQSVVDSLFQHPDFKARLSQAINYQNKLQPWMPAEDKNGQLSEIISEISGLLRSNQESRREACYQELREDVQGIYLELDRIKDTMAFQINKTECLPREFSEDLNLEDEHLFDMPSIQRTIHSLQEKVKEISVNSTILVDTPESKEREGQQERFNSVINQLQESICFKHDLFEEAIDQRLQKQQKTIKHILETLNDLNGSTNSSKTDATLSNSKSATKLKTFFGFKM